MNKDVENCSRLKASPSPRPVFLLSHLSPYFKMFQSPGLASIPSILEGVSQGSKQGKEERVKGSADTMLVSLPWPPKQAPSLSASSCALHLLIYDSNPLFSCAGPAISIVNQAQQALREGQRPQPLVTWGQGVG